MAQPSRPRKPRTEKQLDSARKNISKARGPVSPEGKARSCKNALRHGLDSPRALVVTSFEDVDLYNYHYNQLILQHDPQTPDEFWCLTRMANAYFRQNRLLAAYIARMEGAFEAVNIDGQLDHLNGGLKFSLALDQYHAADAIGPRLLREENFLENSYNRNLRMLCYLKDRRAKHPEEFAAAEARRALYDNELETQLTPLDINELEPAPPTPEGAPGAPIAQLPLPEHLRLELEALGYKQPDGQIVLPNLHQTRSGPPKRP